tara:strand:- start:1470 stop:1736 length:267 start_codon:yes stop_codon:yes gene_type:complete
MIYKQAEQMKTYKLPTWTESDQSKVLEIRDLLGQALEKTDSLEAKIPLYHGTEDEDMATDAMCSLIARIEDALDEILDFQNATAEREE